MNENNVNNGGNNYNIPPQPTNNINTVPVQNEQNINFQQQPVYNQPQNNYQQPMNNQNNNKSNKKILFIIIAIVIVIVGIFVAKNFIGKGTGDKKIDSLFSSDSPIRVKKDKKYGYIDSNGNFIIQPQYDYATDYYGDYAEVALETTVEDNKVKVYQIIDKKGNVKATAKYSSDIEYVDDYDIWIINDQLYNGSLNKISADGIKVDYEKYGYLRWENDSNKTAGIMNTSGKVTYTYKFADGEDYLGVSPSDTDKTLKERYCRITIENNKYGIVNCNTGKVVYDYTDKYISDEDDNIFEVSVKDNYEFVSIMYIQNDKIIYQSSSKNVDLYYSSYGYVQIRDDDKDYSQKYSYIDVSTGQITDKQPSSSNDTDDLDEWEEFSKLTKFSCSTGYGLMSGDKEKIPCEWSEIEYFDLLLYKYLSSNGKKYVMAKKDDKTYLLNLKDGKAAAEFNSTYIYTDSDSTFIYYEDSKTNKKIIYNLITGKSISVENETNLDTYSNYITLEEDGKLNYYNMNLKLIYTEE